MSTTNSNDALVSLKGSELEELKNIFRAIADVRDRQYGFPAKTYESCFVGSEAVAAMIAKGLAADEEDAVRIGNLLLQAGVFHHVQRAHAFRNEYLFYRFASDENHGTLPDEVAAGSSVRWSDFLGVLTSRPGADGSLQPAMAEPDAELATMHQEELEATGISPLDEHNARLLDNVRPKRWLDPEPKPYNLVVIGAGAGGLVSIFFWARGSLPAKIPSRSTARPSALPKL